MNQESREEAKGGTRCPQRVARARAIGLGASRSTFLSLIDLYE